MVLRTFAVANLAVRIQMVVSKYFVFSDIEDQKEVFKLDQITRIQMLLHSPFFIEKIHASHISKFLKIALVIHITILLPFTKVKYKLTYLQEYLLNLHSEQN